MRHALRHRCSRTALLLALALLPALPSQAAPRPLVMAFTPLPPWETKEHGHFSGAYTEIVRELADRMGLPLQIKECPLKRCLLMLEQGQADIAIALRPSPERDQYLHYLHTPYRTQSADRVFYVKAGTEASAPRHYEDLKGLRIGVRGGAQYFARFDADTSLTKEEVPEVDINFRKLLAGRLDAVVIPEDQGEEIITRLELRGKLVKAPYRAPGAIPRAVSISKKSSFAAQLPAFERAMAAMAHDGSLARLFERFYYQAYKVPHDAVEIK